MPSSQSTTSRMVIVQSMLPPGGTSCNRYAGDVIRCEKPMIGAMKRTSATLLAVAVGTFMVTFDGAAIQMVLPVLHRELDTGVYAVQWVMTAFLLIGTAALLPAGRIGDVYGRDRVWRAGIGLFAIASALCSVMPGLPWLVGARALQGAAAALVTANAAPLLVDAFPRERGRALGLGNIAIAAGLVMGPPVGALLTEV